MINFKYAFAITLTILIGWVSFTPWSEEDRARIDELEDQLTKVQSEKDSIISVVGDLRVEKALYLDSAQTMTTRFAESEGMKKRLIIGYEKILSDISAMPAVEHQSFYAGRYADNDNQVSIGEDH